MLLAIYPIIGEVTAKNNLFPSELSESIVALLSAYVYLKIQSLNIGLESPLTVWCQRIKKKLKGVIIILINNSGETCKIMNKTNVFSCPSLFSIL